jgi:hypothetical protein
MTPVPLVVVAAGAIVIEPVVAVTVTEFAQFAVRLASCVTLLAPVRLRFPPVEATGPPIVKSLALMATVVRGVILVGHGGIPKGSPQELITILKRLEAQRRAAKMPPSLEERELDSKIRQWPRTPETDS